MSTATKATHTELLSWCAGVWEGEGWAGFVTTRPRDRVAPRVKVIAGVTNTDRQLLSPFVSQWGGRLRPRKGTAISRKQCYEWRLEDARAELFLRAIRPYVLGMKIYRLDEVLKHRDSKKATNRRPYATRVSE